MIIDDPRAHFICIFSKETVYGDDPAAYLKYQGKRLTNKESLEHWGTWVGVGPREEMDELARKLDPLVEQGVIPCCKYDRDPLKKEFGMRECVMCIYSDDRDKDELWKIVSGLGVKMRAFFYEREIIERWKPGGLFLERWIEARGLTGFGADMVRADAERRMKKFYGNENALCPGWDQLGLD